jgi:hypothetical protein
MLVVENANLKEKITDIENDKKHLKQDLKEAKQQMNKYEDNKSQLEKA